MVKLPVFRVFGDMLDSVIENLSTAFSISWPWLLVLFPLRMVGELIHVWYGDVGWVHYKLNNIDVDLVRTVIGIFTALTFASIAVNWHRFILRSEVAEGGQRLRLDGLVWRYFVFGIAIAALVFVVAFGGGIAFTIIIFSVAYASTVLGILVGTLVGLPLLLLLLGITFRWSVKLVAVALGDLDFTLGDAWRSTVGNTWRLTWLYLLFAVVIGLIGLLDLGVAYFGGLANSAVIAAVGSAVGILVSWFSTLMGITMLTSLYSFFVEKRSS